MSTRRDDSGGGSQVASRHRGQRGADSAKWSSSAGAAVRLCKGSNRTIRPCRCRAAAGAVGNQQFVDQADAHAAPIQSPACLDVELVDTAPRRVHRAGPRRSTPLAGAGCSSTSAAASRQRLSRSRRVPTAAAIEQTMPGASASAPSGACAASESTTTRSGCPGVGTSRTSSRGSSASTVPMPVSTAWRGAARRGRRRAPRAR